MHAPWLHKAPVLVRVRRTPSLYFAIILLAPLVPTTVTIDAAQRAWQLWQLIWTETYSTHLMTPLASRTLKHLPWHSGDAGRRLFSIAANNATTWVFETRCCAFHRFPRRLWVTSSPASLLYLLKCSSRTRRNVVGILAFQSSCHSFFSIPAPPKQMLIHIYLSALGTSNRTTYGTNTPPPPHVSRNLKRMPRLKPFVSAKQSASE